MWFVMYYFGCHALLKGSVALLSIVFVYYCGIFNISSGFYFDVVFISLSYACDLSVHTLNSKMLYKKIKKKNTIQILGRVFCLFVWGYFVINGLMSYLFRYSIR